MTDERHGAAETSEAKDAMFVLRVFADLIGNGSHPVCVMLNMRERRRYVAAIRTVLALAAARAGSSGEQG
jgi:hypothetical protein